MKRPSSSDSMFADDQNSHGYGRDYQAMLDDEACLEECGQVSEKKRRLSVDQVKALEKNFEVENKLEPDRKAQLAQELGLQPRQVAVWFQNRRARWKTKQLERDYGVLKANFDALQCNYESMKDENESLVNEIRELKSKLRGDNSDSRISVKEEPIIPEADELQIEHTSIKPLLPSSPSESDQLITDPNYNSYNDHVSVYKDGGSSDSSDSSAILNNEGSSSPNADMSSSSLLRFTTTTVTNAYQVSGEAHKGYQPQFVKIEEHNFFSGDEACNFFSDDQAPTLQWYCSESDQWS